jgi:hypothetical protein
MGYFKFSRPSQFWSLPHNCIPVSYFFFFFPARPSVLLDVYACKHASQHGSNFSVLKISSKVETSIGVIGEIHQNVQLMKQLPSCSGLCTMCHCANKAWRMFVVSFRIFFSFQQIFIIPSTFFLCVCFSQLAAKIAKNRWASRTRAAPNKKETTEMI